MRQVYWAPIWLSPVIASLKDLANCDPLRKDMRCPPDAAFASKTSFDFTAAKREDSFLDFWTIDDEIKDDKEQLDFNTNGDGLATGMWKAGDAPTLVSNRYLLFGKVSVTVQAAKGPGLITAMVLKSDSGDEIDWELLGAYEKQATTNYFYDGQALFNTYNDTYALESSSFDSFNKYSLEWTDQFLSFSINDQIRKIWYIGEIPPGKWPQTPMQIKLGVWSVTNESDHGEIEWAGGVPDWDQGPFKAYFRNIEVEDYAGWCNKTDGYVEYQYDERTVGWQNIRIAGCHGRPGPTLPAPSHVSTQDATPTDEAAGPSGGKDDDEGIASVSMRLTSSVAFGLTLLWFLIPL